MAIALSLATDLVDYILEYGKLSAHAAGCPSITFRVQRLFDTDQIEISAHRSEAFRSVTYVLSPLQTNGLLTHTLIIARDRVPQKWTTFCAKAILDMVNDLAGPYASPEKEKVFVEMGLTREERRKAVEVDIALEGSAPDVVW